MSLNDLKNYAKNTCTDDFTDMKEIEREFGPIQMGFEKFKEKPKKSTVVPEDSYWCLIG